MSKRYLSLAVLLIVHLLAACSSPLDIGRRAALQREANVAASEDTPLQGRPDLDMPAFLESNGREALDPPTCNGYCMRLLYSGEAKTVISGFAVPNDREDCDDLLDQRADEWRKTHPSQKVPDYILRSCGWLSYSLHQLTGEPRPVAWHDSSRDQRPYLVWANAYHLERRKSCPNVSHFDSWGGGFDRAVRGRETTSDDTFVDHNIAAGLCLIEAPADLRQASSIFLFSHSDTTTHANNGNRRDSSSTHFHLTVYGEAAKGRLILYRHTISTYSYLPVLAPSGTFDSATFDVSTETEKSGFVDHLRGEIGLKLADVPNVAFDPRQAIAAALDDKTLDFTSSKWKLVRDYLASLKARGPGQVDDADAILIGRLISDGRTTIQLRDLPEIIKSNPQAGDILAGPLLDALNRFPYALDGHSGPHVPWGDDERQRIAAAGPGHDELINAGLTRLDDLDASAAILPDRSVAQHLDVYRKIVADPDRTLFIPKVVNHLNVLPPTEAIPILRRFIDDRGSDRNQDALTLSAMQATCRMGPRGEALLPDVSAYLVAAAKTNAGPYADMTEEAAWATLDNFDRARALAQAPDAKPQLAELFYHGRLNCDGLLYP